MSTIRLGIGGVPIGEATLDQRKPKQDIPCSAFQNTLNKSTALNNNRPMNTQLAMNTAHTITFKSSDDILGLLKSHPDILRVPPDTMEAIAAALYSVLAIGAGVTLTVLSGGLAGAPTMLSLAALSVGTALTSAGASGLQTAIRGGIQGTFTWSTWGSDVAISGVTSLIVFPATLLAGSTAGTLAARTVFMDGTLCRAPAEAATYIHKCIMVASTIVSSAGHGGSEIVKGLVKKGKVDFMSLVISLAVGCWGGYKLGEQISNLKTEKLIMDHINRLNEYFKDPASRNLITVEQIDGLLQNKEHIAAGAHAVSRHGPDAILTNHPSYHKIPTVSGFSRMEQMVASVQETVASGTATPKWVRIVFSYNVQDININWVANSGGSGTDELTSGIVKVVVHFETGQLPKIITAFPTF